MTEDDTLPISSFTGEYSFLSNFSPHPVKTSDGRMWRTVEHAYQAAKTNNQEDKDWIASKITPASAKVAGQNVEKRSDWEDDKLNVMKDMVTLKFTQHPDIAKKLLATGNRPLIEGNTWGDRFWGVYRGKGENYLGRILMEVRDNLRNP